MIDKLIKNDCIHCKGCQNICPKKAISFHQINSKLILPKVEEESCINCGLCIKVCPNLLEPKKYERNHEAFACYNKDIKIKKESSSGGVFFALAEYIIEKKGYVVGTIFDEKFLPKHIVTNNIENVKKMMGSKYTQSDLGNVYYEIKKILDNKKIVLFTGCPCQVLALNKYLGREYQNLVLVDFVCHGVPNQNIWISYLKILEKKYNSKIKRIKFRDKKYGWHKSSFLCDFENGKEYCQPITLDPYMKGFLKGITINEGCYSCKTKKFSSFSDLTLGDYWGAEILEKSIDDNKGISAVIVHSKKGRELLMNIKKENLFIKSTSIDGIIKYNQNILYPTRKNLIYELFFDYADQYSIEKSIKKYLYEKKSQYLKRKIRENLKYVYYKVSHKRNIY